MKTIEDIKLITKNRIKKMKINKKIESTTMEICLNGHITDQSRFCSLCGEKAIIRCLHCDSLIKPVPPRDLLDPFPYRPSFCFNCGKPYPWTERELEKEKKDLSRLED